MHRRTFLALLGAIPFWATTAGATPTAAVQDDWVRRDFEPLDPKHALIGIHALAVQYDNETAAREAIDQLRTDGFLHRPGVTANDFPPIEILPTPEEIDLPAALRSYEGATPPASGLDIIPYVTLDVQRGDILVSITVRGTDESELVETATALMVVMLDYDPSAPEPVMDETGRHSGGLWDYMLQEADAPKGFRMYQESDESGAVQIAA